MERCTYIHTNTHTHSLFQTHIHTNSHTHIDMHIFILLFRCDKIRSGVARLINTAEATAVVGIIQLLLSPQGEVDRPQDFGLWVRGGTGSILPCAARMRRAIFGGWWDDIAIKLVYPAFRVLAFSSLIASDIVFTYFSLALSLSLSVCVCVCVCPFLKINIYRGGSYGSNGYGNGGTSNRGGGGDDATKGSKVVDQALIERIENEVSSPVPILIFITHMAFSSRHFNVHVLVSFSCLSSVSISITRFCNANHKFPGIRLLGLNSRRPQ